MSVKEDLQKLLGCYLVRNKDHEASQVMVTLMGGDLEATLKRCNLWGLGGENHSLETKTIRQTMQHYLSLATAAKGKQEKTWAEMSGRTAIMRAALRLSFNSHQYQALRLS